VAAAIRTARPYGIEVSSGVEAVQGIKDSRRLRELIEAAKAA
jgi:phosphoribosylanthranilate isomerase